MKSDNHMTTIEKMKLDPKSRKIHMLSSICLLIFTTLPVISCFNVDVDSPVLLQPPGEDDIDFGFSLAHIVNGSDRSVRLLVGAPKSNTSQDINRPGALYSCELDSADHTCHRLDVDTRMNHAAKYTPFIGDDLKEDQRLGFSVVANENFIVVCAPRWHAHDRRRQTGTIDFPYGICFAAKAPDYEFRAFSPSYDSATKLSTGYFDFGSCQHGISLAFLDETNIAAGSPGCWEWQGDVWQVNVDSLDDTESNRRLDKVSLRDLKFETNEDDSSKAGVFYLGYSTTTMTYAQVRSIVSSMPRVVDPTEQKMVLGPVVQILQADTTSATKLKVIETLKQPMNAHESSSDTMFSYFGYSVMAVDVNNDNLDDVIIGAPFFHNRDQGAIFVYMQKKFSFGGDDLFEYEMKPEDNAPRRIGKESYGRFGSCIAAIGDIDGDGFNDIAVGAPFLLDGGAIYIYRGSSNGLEIDASQVIRASQLPSSLKPYKGFGFGFSISQQFSSKTSSGINLAVGAFNSSFVAVFRTKSVIWIEWELQIPDTIDLTEKGKRCASNPCTEIQICVNFTIRTSPPNSDSLECIINLRADKDKKLRRLFFSDSGSPETSFSMTLKENTNECSSLNVSAKPKFIRDVEPFIIEAEIGFSKKGTDKVVHDPRVELIKTEKLNILVPCNYGDSASQCESDIRLSTIVLNNFDLADQKPIQIQFTIENHGEPSYNTRLQVLSTGGDLKLQSCIGDDTMQTIQGGYECDIKLILESNKMETFNLSLTPTEAFFNSLQTHGDRFNITANVTSTSIIIDPDKSVQNLEIPILVDDTLDLTRDSDSTSTVYYNDSSYFKPPHKAEDEEQLGDEVIHIYKIFNKYKYPIYKARINIRWPLKIKGKYFLYLMDSPIISNNSHCNHTNGHIDEYKLNTDNNTFEVEGIFFESPDVDAVLMRNSLQDVESEVEYLRLNCLIGEISPSQEISIKLRSRFVQNTIKELEMGNQVLLVSSHGQAQALELPLGAKGQFSPEIKIVTNINYNDQTPDSKVPWWAWIVAVVIGLVVLGILVLILWKVGFFKRIRVDKADGNKTNDEETEKLDNPEVDGETNEGEKEDIKTPDVALLRDTVNANDEFTHSRKNP